MAKVSKSKNGKSFMDYLVPDEYERMVRWSAKERTAELVDEINTDLFLTLRSWNGLSIESIQESLIQAREKTELALTELSTAFSLLSKLRNEDIGRRGQKAKKHSPQVPADSLDRARE